MKMRITSALVAAIAILAGWTAAGRPAHDAAGPDHQQTIAPLSEQTVRAFAFRNTGPFRMQARIAAIAVPTAPVRDHLYTFYVAPWIGGVFKTTNNGTTFEPVFDEQGT